MADPTVTAADIRPLNGALRRRAIAGEALTFGTPVYVDSYSGTLPSVKKADGSSTASANVFGIVVAPDTATAGSSVASGAACDVVWMGPVAGYSGMTSGATMWVSDTAGVVSDAVGTASGVIGFAESPTVLFVRPGLYIVST